MSFSLGILANIASCMFLQSGWGAVNAAAPPQSCPRSESFNTLLTLHGTFDGPRCRASTSHVVDHDYSSEVIRSLEDKVLRLQKTLDELRKKLDVTHCQSQDSPLVHNPSFGNAQDLLFAVRQMQLSTKASFVELISLTRKRDEAFILALSSVLIVGCSHDGILEARSVGDPSIAVTLKTTHSARVLSMLLFPKGDDVAILTTDEDGVALLHVLAARRREANMKAAGPTTTGPSTARRISISPVVLSLEPADTFRVSRGGTSRHNCVVSATVKGERVVMVGDSDGYLSVFSKNGLLKSKVKVTNEDQGVLHLAHFGGLTIFATRTCVGQLDPMAAEVSGRMSCIGVSASIASIALDARRHGRGAVALADGQVLYMDVKTWTLLHKFPVVLAGPAKIFFAKEKIFAVTLAGSRLPYEARTTNICGLKNGIAVFDLISVERPESVRGPVVHLLPLDIEAGSLTVLRRTGDTSILAVTSSNGDIVRLFECLHSDQPVLSDESWSHIRLPIMLVTILVAIVAQVYRTKRSSSNRRETEEDLDTAAHLDVLWKERLQRKRNAYVSEYSSYADHAHCPNTDVADLDD